MNGLLTLTLCALSGVPIISTVANPALDSADFEETTRDVYGSWTVGDSETSESEEYDEETTTDSQIRKDYWNTRYWRTTQWDSLDAEKTPASRGMKSSYSYRGSRPYSRKVRRNRTTRVITGRWPSTRLNGSLRHSVRPGFGRPRRNKTTLFKLMTPGYSRRRIPRVHYTYRSRASPYFHWHTLRNENSTGSRMRIIRGPRNSYGTRKPPRPNRFQWVSRYHRTRVYPGNLTCRLFVVRNRTSSLLFGPHRTATTPSLETQKSTQLYRSESIPGTGAPSSTNASTEPYQGALFSARESKQNTLYHIDAVVTNILRLQNDGLALAHSTIGLSQVNQSSSTTTTTEDPFPDMSYQLKYSIESVPEY